MFFTARTGMKFITPRSQRTIPLGRLAPFNGGTGTADLVAPGAHFAHTRRFVRFSCPQLRHVIIGFVSLWFVSAHPFQKRFARCVTENMGQC